MQWATGRSEGSMAMSEGRGTGNRDSLGYERIALLEKRLRRRALLSGSAPAGTTGTAAPSPAAASPAAALPADAAAPDQQVYIVNTTNEVKVFDFWEAVYARPTINSLFSEPLVRLNNDYELQPGAAE